MRVCLEQFILQTSIERAVGEKTSKANQLHKSRQFTNKNILYDMKNREEKEKTRHIKKLDRRRPKASGDLKSVCTSVAKRRGDGSRDS